MLFASDKYKNRGYGENPMLWNSKRKTTLAPDITVCRSLLAKATGLMFRPQLRGRAMVFPFPTERRISLHMLFVFFPIDVLFLDKRGHVVEVKERLAPFWFHSSRKPARAAVELPAGTIQKSRTHVGDRIAGIDF